MQQRDIMKNRIDAIVSVVDGLLIDIDFNGKIERDEIISLKNMLRGLDNKIKQGCSRCEITSII